MFDPGLQRLPPPAVREQLERREQEIETEVEHNRLLHAARKARWEQSGIRAALRRIGHALSRHR